jgi:E3 ubiquitin-protein ligase RAD18
MLKDAQLRRELTDFGLSTIGNRAMLERRHREWVMIWNANCDSQRPRRQTELLHDLDAWERTLGSRAPTGSRAANMGTQIRDKDFDGAAWASKHDTSFRDLIADARRTRAQAQTNPKESTKDDGVNSIPASDKAGGTQLAPEVKPTDETSHRQELLGTERVLIDLTDNPPGTPALMQMKDEREGKSGPT